MFRPGSSHGNKANQKLRNFPDSFQHTPQIPCPIIKYSAIIQCSSQSNPLNRNQLLNFLIALLHTNKIVVERLYGYILATQCLESLTKNSVTALRPHKLILCYEETGSHLPVYNQLDIG